MGNRSKLRPAPEPMFPLSPKLGFLRRRREHPVGVRGGPRRAPRGYWLGRVGRGRVRDEYGLRGRQLAYALEAAAARPGDVAENLAGQLEQRLDALVRRAGFARNPREARDLVTHNQFTVDGGKVNRPSYQVRPGQTVQVRHPRQSVRPVALAVIGTTEEEPPPYLQVRPDRLTATLTREPRREEIPGLRDTDLAVHEEAVRAEVTR